MQRSSLDALAKLIATLARGMQSSILGKNWHINDCYWGRIRHDGVWYSAVVPGLHDCRSWGTVSAFRVLLVESCWYETLAEGTKSNFSRCWKVALHFGNLFSSGFSKCSVSRELWPSFFRPKVELSLPPSTQLQAELLATGQCWGVQLAAPQW